MRIGSILHGALGDIYEQALAFQMRKDRYSGDTLVAFFARQDRLEAFRHYALDMFDEIYLWDEIPKRGIDRFDQFQIKDGELADEVFANLPTDTLAKFDFQKRWLPWQVIRQHNFAQSPMRLELSAEGKQHYAHVLAEHDLTEEAVAKSVGYLWRYRPPGGAIKPWLQAPKESILRTKSELFSDLVNRHGLKIIAAGMNYQSAKNQELSQVRSRSGVLDGEINSKFTADKLDVADEHVTYLKGLGYAAELEIIAKTRFQLLMPSGFSEPIWMMNRQKTLLVDPPPVYLLKLLKNRMPLFDNTRWGSWLYNSTNCHSAKRVMAELSRRKLI